jgi:holo-[acyl-carrier protein] synthase
MIIGLGTDIVYIPRMETLFAQYGERLAGKLLTASELDTFRVMATSKAQIAFLAKRFAAKEAAVKALGVGFSGDITLQDIAVITSESGKPSLRFYGHAAALLAEWQAVTHLSLADDYPMAIATVCVEKALA